MSDEIAVSTDGKRVLQALSVIYHPVGRTALAHCLVRAGLRMADGSAFNPQKLGPVLEELEQRQLVVKSDQGTACVADWREPVTRQTLTDGSFELLARASEEAAPIPGARGSPYFRTYEQAVRVVRHALYRQDPPGLDRALHQAAAAFPTLYADQPPLWLVCQHPFDASWFDSLPRPMAATAVWQILSRGFRCAEPTPEAYAWLERQAEHLPAPYVGLCARQRLLRGDVEGARALVEDGESVEAQAIGGWLNFLAGDAAGAIARYEAALKRLKQDTKRRKVYFADSSGLFFIFALLRDGSPARLEEAHAYCDWAEREPGHPLGPAYRALRMTLLGRRGDAAAADLVANWLGHAERAGSLAFLVAVLALAWLDAKRAAEHVEEVEDLARRLKQAGYAWLAAEADRLAARLHGRAMAGHGLIDVLQLEAPWERALAALAAVPAPAAKDLAAAPTRLAWFVTFHERTGLCSFEPREQKLDARGQWTKGRAVALKRLRSGDGLDSLTDQDRAVCAHLVADYGGYWGAESYYFDAKALLALVGHPLLFRADQPDARVELVRGAPRLRVRRETDQIALSLSPPPPERGEPVVVRETPTRLKVVEYKPEHQRIAAVLGSGLKVPEQARERVLQALTSVASLVEVHSDIGGVPGQAEPVAGDATVTAHLIPAGADLKVQLLTQPLGAEGPHCRPGEGAATLIADVGGRRLQATRDLARERANLAAALAACPTLAAAPERDGEWLLEDPEHCLELLLELQGAGEVLRAVWPEGERLKVRGTAGTQQLRLSVRGQSDWFTLSGELRLEEGLVLDMRQLVEAAKQTHGRFLALGDGEFVALTDAFRKRLAELAALAEAHGKGARVHRLAAPLLEELAEEAGRFSADRQWKEHLARLEEAEALDPEPPSTLRAELRDYQREGFRWAARLAHLGVGACLADDMGLGKTVQALAVILGRAPQGPTLVVAPTSVCGNWTAEAARFAPTLNVIPFGGPERTRRLAELQPFDLVVASYGLLNSDADAFADVEWQTVILDEAQAIKNMATKRSQAAMALNAGFRMITTGTPVENHLGELWNLFRFLNPGLLGSLESFNERYAVPIEKQHDRQAKANLKRLIQPFILRRTKEQVLEELPPRTEITLEVELSPEEAALYEALRRQAVEKLTVQPENAGQRQLQILAEITRLRRYCCHPRLAVADTPLPGAKLAAFRQVLDELLDNRHKALVFSQFVDHLAILRAELDSRDIAYQYLDGSTPAPERVRRVAAFQAGEGEVFLISLKAGGTGLNLTAADYVIHMDPWWNPAVEDQASDRAHRMGQSRPVTVYRLVAKGTIEEKIVALHAAKRDLADSLLEGTEAGGRMSAEDLLRLLREGSAPD